MIPETAIQAACHAYRHPSRMVTNTSDGRHRDCMEAALEAALPNLEAAIRKQIAADIERRKRDLAEGYADMAKAMLEAGMEEAARIAEEGTTK